MFPSYSVDYFHKNSEREISIVIKLLWNNMSSKTTAIFVKLRSSAI